MVHGMREWHMAEFPGRHRGEMSREMRIERLVATCLDRLVDARFVRVLH